MQRSHGAGVRDPVKVWHIRNSEVRSGGGRGVEVGAYSVQQQEPSVHKFASAKSKFRRRHENARP